MLAANVCAQRRASSHVRWSALSGCLVIGKPFRKLRSNVGRKLKGSFCYSRLILRRSASAKSFAPCKWVSFSRISEPDVEMQVLGVLVSTKIGGNTATAVLRFDLGSTSPVSRTIFTGVRPLRASSQ